MLFTNILLCVWFVAWLVHAFWLKDFGDVVTRWMEAIMEDEYGIVEPAGEILEKSESQGVYHLNCPECGHDWWSTEAFPNFCPNCGVDRRK